MVCRADGSFWQTTMFCSLDYLYLPARDIEASVRYDTDQLCGQLVWKIHAFNAWVAAVRLSPTGPLVMLADHLDGDGDGCRGWKSWGFDSLEFESGRAARNGAIDCGDAGRLIAPQ